MTKKNKEKNQPLVPELRFPEFKKDRGWNERPLGNFLNEHKTKDNGHCQVHSVSVHKGVINQKEHLGRSFAAKNTSNYNLAYPNDVIYTKSPTGEFPFGIVKQNRLKENVIVSPLYGVFTPVTSGVGYIVDCFFESPQRAFKYLDPITQKGARNTIQITSQGFLSGLVRFPNNSAEQQKIAGCLESLDNLIAANSAKLNALQNHKKSLLQQLFPAEGQTIPTLRIPKFYTKKPWTKCKTSTVLRKISLPIEISTENEYREIGIRSHGKGIFHKQPVSGKVIGNKRVFQVIENALTLNIVFAWEQAVATTSKEEIDMIASHRFPMYVSKRNNCDVRFIKLFFLTPEGKHLLSVASPGGAGRNRTLGQKEFEKLELLLPTKEEQTEIADIFTNVEMLITAQTEKTATLKEHKKSLMQQLFPNSERSKS